jgi:hypothetical protein
MVRFGAQMYNISFATYAILFFQTSYSRFLIPVLFIFYSTVILFHIYALVFFNNLLLLCFLNEQFNVFRFKIEHMYSPDYINFLFISYTT